ncbi:calcium-binding protein [Propionivibrio dicarboxylicus]|uniref:Ca2+-binding protein, RTX toxin-related n=1 Tax=Propionivibrio dicarboxylicus TaxID=83767 RepID=A0A1G8I1J0_9RHOO|nr:calcium-binding protein [Propionivibrio dicarboxylicus]SDI12717.1 Ca2+-binding protein, RTX toxin-related [Propionivibrio dicarboxylicus]
MEFIPGSTLTEFGIKGTNYCGPGYSDGKFGGDVDKNGTATNAVDNVCKIHDDGYTNAEKSATPAADRLAADSKLLNDIRDLVRGGTLSQSESEIAAAMLAAFMYKRRYYDVPTSVAEDAKGLLKDILDSLGINDKNPLGVGFSPSSLLRYRDVVGETNITYGRSRTAIPIPPRRDPLVLDLDSDGIETLGIDAANPILFDHADNGVRIATGWLKSDDAFLVADRDQDGTIDSGAELFSDSTPLDAGGIAADGFAALAQEDSNHDGVVDANDADWANLRLWRDLNQDGIAQADELFTLANEHISALRLARSAQNTTQANGNRIADTGVYVRDDASIGTMGDIDLVTNPFVSRFTDPIVLTDAARDLADMQGAGMVRSLREAASLYDALVAEIQSLDGTTRMEMLDRLDTLLADWAGTSTQRTSTDAAAAKGYRLVYLPPGMSIADYWATRRLDDNTIATALVANNPSEYARLQTLKTQQETLSARIGILERFNAQAFVTVGDTGVTTGQGTVITALAAAQTGGPATDERDAFVSLNTAQTPLLDQAYTALKQSAYNALAPQTRLKPYFDGIGLTIDENGFRLDYSEMDAVLDAVYAGNKAKGITDCLDLKRYAGDIDESYLGLMEGKVTGWIERAVRSGEVGAINAALTQAYSSLGMTALTAYGGSSGNDYMTIGTTRSFVLGLEGNDTIDATVGGDTIDGGGGDDLIMYGTGGRDNTVCGGDGDDYIQPHYANNYFNYTNYISGGKGDDFLIGDQSNNVYYFNLGDGNDTVLCFGKSGEIVFGEGIAPGDVSISASTRGAIILRITDPTTPSSRDTITIDGWYYAHMQHLKVKFVDGTIWSPDYLTTCSLIGTCGNDQLFLWYGQHFVDGGDGDDQITSNSCDALIYGGNGNDTIYGGDSTVFGGAGDDTIDNTAGGVVYGDDGNDTITFSSRANSSIEGGNGNDLIQMGHRYWSTGQFSNTLNGGAGNDRIKSGASADTYLFNRGDGNDIINDYGANDCDALSYYGASDYGAPGADQIVFSPDIAPEQLWFRHVGNNLEIDVIGTADSVTVENWYAGSTYHIEQFKTADGKVLVDTQVDLLIQAMASFNPPPAGQTVLPPNYQEALIPVLAANWK